MSCKQWREMTNAEQMLFIAKLTAVVQYREGGYMAAKMIIEAAEETGFFEKVKVGHDAVYPKEEPAY